MTSPFQQIMTSHLSLDLHSLFQTPTVVVVVKSVKHRVVVVVKLITEKQTIDFLFVLPDFHII